MPGIQSEGLGGGEPGGKGRRKPLVLLVPWDSFMPWIRRDIRQARGKGLHCGFKIQTWRLASWCSGLRYHLESCFVFQLHHFCCSSLLMHLQRPESPLHTHTGDSEKTSGFWLWPGPILLVIAVTGE